MAQQMEEQEAIRNEALHWPGESVVEGYLQFHSSLWKSWRQMGGEDPVSEVSSEGDKTGSSKLFYFQEFKD